MTSRGAAISAGGPGRTVGRVVSAVVAALVGALTFATPAWAHGADAPNGTDYRTEVREVTPAVPELTVRVIEAGARLELVNRTGRTIEVLGYSGEPYLAVRPDGVYENVNSPATYLNRTLAGDTTLPANANPATAPSWQRVSTEPVARWHDQRTQWREAGLPRAAQVDPGREHRIRDWAVPLRDGTSALEIRGTLDWVPPPSPLLWWAITLLLAVLVAALGRATMGPTTPVPASGPVTDPVTPGEETGLSRTGTIALAVLSAIGGVAAISFAVAREFDAGATGFGDLLQGLLTGQIWAVLTGLGALAAGAYALARRPAADFALALAGACLALFAGVTNAAAFARSIVPVPWPATPARFVVALTIVTGAGVGLAGVLRLRAAGRAGAAGIASTGTGDPTPAGQESPVPAGQQDPAEPDAAGRPGG
ncbi:hypothetical protein GCM10027290_06520 [Micromonospora sonneratiae]|uniref:Uncharacterized protein n=1 Tax=Micromonospora sonneratiae TaxID=1184706 RepID=A0ABW3Y9A8_9ACTN